MMEYVKRALGLGFNLATIYSVAYLFNALGLPWILAGFLAVYLFLILANLSERF